MPAFLEFFIIPIRNVCLLKSNGFLIQCKVRLTHSRKKIRSDINYHTKNFKADYEKCLASNLGEKLLFDYPSWNQVPPWNSEPHRLFRPRARFWGREIRSTRLIFRSGVKAPDEYGEAFQWTILKCSVLMFVFDAFTYCKLMRKIKPSTTEPYDGIPPIVFRKWVSFLCQPLTHVLHFLSSRGAPIPAKIMERVISKQAFSWLNRFHIIPIEQHRFVTGSTGTNLVDRIHDRSIAPNAFEQWTSYIWSLQKRSTLYRILSYWLSSFLRY